MKKSKKAEISTAIIKGLKSLIGPVIILAIIAVGVYVAQKIFHIEYEFIPVAFDVLMLGALFPIYDSNIYTVYEKIENWKKYTANISDNLSKKCFFKSP